MTALHIDFETRSPVDLKKCGVYVYAEHPQTDVWCAAYAVDDGPVQLWVSGDPVPPEVIRAVEEGQTFVVHNAQFERIIWKHVLTPRYGWPEPKLEQWRCTMAMAYAMALPGSLENAAAAVGLSVRKDMEGHSTMMRMAKPRKPRKGEDPRGVYWFDDEDRKQKLYAYCKNDVEVERQLEKRLFRLHPDEQKLWCLDQEINDRGVYVDLELCLAAKKIVDEAEAELDREMLEATGGFVGACTNAGQIAEWLNNHGLEDVSSIAKGEVESLLARDDLSPQVRRVLELRQRAAKASVAKIDSLLAGRSKDGRARGLMQFHAASTGRWGGRRFQPQNIKRPDMDDESIDGAIDVVLTGSAQAVEMLYGDPLSVVGDCLRGMVCAENGGKIIAADFSNIEGRVTAWVAGEAWKIQAFRDFDAGTGHDIYNLTAAKILRKKPEDITKAERQGYGKVPELALGFQGGVGAFQKMAHNYGVRFTDAEADEIKVNWRGEHPRIVQTWYDLENAAIEALSTPNRIVHCGKVRFRTAGSFLALRLPSGRCLFYPYAKIVQKETPWGALKPTVQYMGVDSYTRKWTECYAYGGLWMENIAQAIARDVLADGLVRLDARGYPVALHVHDEAVAECLADFGSVKDFEQVVSEVPAWADGLPVAASGFQAQRYRK